MWRSRVGPRRALLLVPTCSSLAHSRLQRRGAEGNEVHLSRRRFPVGLRVLAVAVLAGGCLLLYLRVSPSGVSSLRAIHHTEGELDNSSSLGGYNVLIADRGNNRVLEVTPDKQVIWAYKFALPRKGLGADDAFFADNGRTIIMTLEYYHVIQQIDYQSRRVIWSYGVPGHAGAARGYLNRPDDAYKLPNGDVSVADIKNCRVLEIAPDKSIVRQYGVRGHCGSAMGLLDKPNGDTPLSNGHTLISIIADRRVIELDQSWRPVFTMRLPVHYPSDPQVTKAGNILISDYSVPGKIVEVSRAGEIVWEYGCPSGPGELKKPSLAMELPNGNILSSDDLNHRVIVIEKPSRQIVWQYGVTGRSGEGPDQLRKPDGVDIIMRSPARLAGWNPRAAPGNLASAASP